MSLSRKSVLILVLLILSGCGSTLGVASTTTTSTTTSTTAESTTAESTTTSTATTSATVVSITTPTTTVGDLVESPPLPYLLYDGQGFSVQGKLGEQSVDIASLSSAMLMGDSVVFTVSSGQAIYIWPNLSGLHDVAKLSGVEVGLLATVAESETRLRLLDGVSNGVDSILFVEESLDELQSSLWVQQLDGSPSKVFDLASRRRDMTEEEEDAFLLSAAIGRDFLVLITGIGDGTTIEWYDLGGEPVALALDLQIPGAAVEVSLSATEPLIALSVETQLHGPIQTLLLIDYLDGSSTRWDLGTSGSLSELMLNNRTVSATVWEDGPAGGFVVTIQTGGFLYIASDRLLTLER